MRSPAANGVGVFTSATSLNFHSSRPVRGSYPPTTMRSVRPAAVLRGWACSRPAARRAGRFQTRLPVARSKAARYESSVPVDLNDHPVLEDDGGTRVAPLRGGVAEEAGVEHAQIGPPPERPLEVEGSTTLGLRGPRPRSRPSVTGGGVGLARFHVPGWPAGCPSATSFDQRTFPVRRAQAGQAAPGGRSCRSARLDAPGVAEGDFRRVLAHSTEVDEEAGSRPRPPDSNRPWPATGGLPADVPSGRDIPVGREVLVVEHAPREGAAERRPLLGRGLDRERAERGTRGLRTPPGARD